MLLACDYTEDGKEKVELLTAPWAAPGTIIQIEGAEYTSEKPWQQARPLKKVSKFFIKNCNNSFYISCKDCAGSLYFC